MDSVGFEFLIIIVFFFVIAYCLCPHFWDSKHYSAHSKPDSKHLEITPVFVDLKNGTITDTFVRLKKKWKSQIFLRSKHQPLPIQENEWVLTCLHHKVRSHLCTASAEKNTCPIPQAASRAPDKHIWEKGAMRHHFGWVSCLFGWSSTALKFFHLHAPSVSRAVRWWRALNGLPLTSWISPFSFLGISFFFKVILSKHTPTFSMQTAGRGTPDNHIRKRGSELGAGLLGNRPFSSCLSARLFSDAWLVYLGHYKSGLARRLNLKTGTPIQTAGVARAESESNHHLNDDIVLAWRH